MDSEKEDGYCIAPFELVDELVDGPGSEAGLEFAPGFSPTFGSRSRSLAAFAWRRRAFAARADLAMSGYVTTVAMQPPILPAIAWTYAGSFCVAMISAWTCRSRCVYVLPVCSKKLTVCGCLYTCTACMRCRLS